MEEISFKAIPTFRILDIEKAKEFYIRYLGFIIDWEHRFAENEPVYMQISRKGLVIHLSENNRFKVGNIIFVQTTGIEKLQQELAAKDFGSERSSISIAPWNAKVMEIEDPFGNLIRFNQDLPKK